MSNVKETIEAVQGIVEAVPVYEDMLQPASKELGKGALTLAKTINMVLAPLSLMVWSFEKVKTTLVSGLEKKLTHVPEENIVTPAPEIAVPAIEALRYTGHNDELREMFTNLLATSMDNDTAANAHPSFVEIIKQISSDEAKIIQYLVNEKSLGIIRVRLFELNTGIEKYAEPLANFSSLPYEINCAYPEQGTSYFENLERLGLISLSYDVYKTTPNAYEKTENHPVVNEWRDNSPRLNKRFEIQRGGITLTSFGRKFIDACVISK